MAISMLWRGQALIVVCHHQNHDSHYSELLIISVAALSKTTRRTDQTLKRLAYQGLSSLEICVE